MRTGNLSVQLPLFTDRGAVDAAVASAAVRLLHSGDL